MTLSKQDYPPNSPFLVLKTDDQLRFDLVRCFGEAARHELSLGFFMSNEETTQKLKEWLGSETGAKAFTDCFNNLTGKK